MSDITSVENVHIEGNKLYIPEGDPEKSKEQFFRLMEQRAKILDGDTYKRTAGKNNAFGHFGLHTKIISTEKSLTNAYIIINRDDFMLNGEDYTDLIPLTIRHESYEMWIYAKRGWSLFPTPAKLEESNVVNFAHNLALREEYRYAFELGKGERLLEFMKKWTSQHNFGKDVLKKDIEAFQKAQSRS